MSRKPKREMEHAMADLPWRELLHRLYLLVIKRKL